MPADNQLETVQPEMQPVVASPGKIDESMSESDLMRLRKINFKKKVSGEFQTWLFLSKTLKFSKYFRKGKTR